MKFSVGYQLKNDFSLIDTINENKQYISDVYFSFGDFPNGRSNLNKDGFFYENIQKQLADLEKLGDMPLNLLFNGNCYGKDALARSFYNKIGDTVNYLQKFNLKCVTTTSPLIARFIKENFDLETRASVNMGIGTVEGFEYIKNLFDSFYLAREYNRDFNRIKEIRAWCDDNNKKLYGLANSGCLKNCSAHTFHDNLVAHESESAQMDNAYIFEGQCKIFFKDEENRKNWLKYMTFIRPEDVSLYENLFDGLKLATRVNSSPERIIRSYVKGSFSGAVTSLLEPDHTAMFYPNVIENKKLDLTYAFNCNKQCYKCNKCSEIQNNATINLNRIL